MLPILARIVDDAAVDIDGVLHLGGTSCADAGTASLHVTRVGSDRTAVNPDGAV